MEKQITTVYVLTEDIKDFYLDKWVELEWIPEGYLDKKRAYLYTPEEHAAVQGYREALDRIRLITHYKAIQNDNMERIIHSANQLSQQALSKAEDTHVSDIHVGNIPTNSLDELERDILSNYDMDDALLVSYIIAKIKELKTITT